MITMENTKRPTIGLIDDHRIVRRGIRSQVEAFDEFTVVFDVENFEELKKQLKDNRTLDLLLMDIKMPDITGFELVIWMKENYPLIKVLALSSEEDGFSIAKVMRNGARGFVGKSAGENEVLLGIRTVLKGDTYLSQTDFNKFSDVIQSSTNYFTNQNVDLSELEKEFLNWCCTSLNYGEIATKMYISTRTANDYRDRLFKKIGVNSRQELAVYAVQNKLLR